MKKQFKHLPSLLLSALLLLISCEKPRPIPPNQTPVDPINYAIKIEVNELSGVNNGLNDLSAIISLNKENDEIFVADKKVNLTYNNGKYTTPNLPAAKGSYKLIKLLILKADGSIFFAAPHVGSQKASFVTKPLSISATTNTTETIINAQVLPVAISDRPQDFGYAAGTFNDTQAENPARQFSLNIHPLLKIGNIVYDSIPVTLKITNHPLQGETLTWYQPIAAGNQQLTLSNQSSKYIISLSKWGIKDTIIISPAEMKSGISYTLGGSIAAKKLKYESVYHQSGSLWSPKTRKEYIYNASGKLTLINHYLKAEDQSTVLDKKEEISFLNNYINKIKISGVGIDQTSLYTYKPDGKLSEISHTEPNHKTTGEVSYFALPERVGLTNDYSISGVFESTKYYYKEFFSFDMHGGNVLKQTYSTSHGNSETSHFEFDSGINPFIHLELPELNFSHLSKNNVINKWTTYINTQPQYYPYSYSYVYDSDGYPIEIYTKYRSAKVLDVYTTKTLLVYY